MKNKRLLVILAIIVTLLLIPLIAMQFTNEVNWELNDFVVMGIMLLGTGLLIELVLRKVTLAKNRFIICGFLLLLLLVVWVELAVGIFGTAIAGS